MVSEDSASNSNSSILHQFIISNQNRFASNQHFDVGAYGTDSVSTNPYPHSLSANIQCLGDRMSRSVNLVHASHLSDESEIHHDMRLMDLLGQSNESTPHPVQRLSLSLGSVPSRQSNMNPGILNPGTCYLDHDYSSFHGENNAFAVNQSCSTSYCTTESFAAAVGASKYLKPAQSLLHEMVAICGKEIDAGNQKYVEKLTRKGSYRLSSELKAEFANTKLLSEKHGIYLNLVKLLGLLEEVERRYEDHYNHVEELVSSFEMIAGLGAGKSYTALALHAMSKHFSSLINSIVSQIHSTIHRVEKDVPKISSILSELSLFDQDQVRPSRVSLQQLGLLHNTRQAWRPIRGLPETSVTILRAWLFEHFLHPYPNDSEKLMLASQTGLSKNQVSNWFINARVRLWKPMIEEMYKEEFAESSTESDQLLTREGIGDSAEDFN